MQPITWDLEAVRTYLGVHGTEQVRFKEPRGCKLVIRRNFGKVAHNCFRNALYAGLCSQKLMYCEGLASIKAPSGRDLWYPHAWCKPRVVSGVPNDTWIFDVTWPWSPRLKRFDPEVSRYIGVCIEPHVAYDFLYGYLPSLGLDDIRLSVFEVR